MIGVGVEPVTWEQFKERFHKNWFYANVRHIKEKKFLGLEQGSMSVEEYDQEFKQLSRFAPPMVAMEAYRTKLFV